MPHITFVQPDGARATVRVEPGHTVMEGARAGGIPGIEAQCGGECCCATCHCYLEPDWYGRLAPPGDHERGLLDFAWEAREHSRLSCQIVVDEAMDGMVVQVPERQL